MGATTSGAVTPYPVLGGSQSPQPAMAQQAQQAFSPIQGNVFQQSAAGLNQAMLGTQQGMMYNPMNVGVGNAATSLAGSQGFNAAQAGSQGYNAATAGSQGYNAAQAGSQGYNSANAGSQGYNAALAGYAPSVNAQNVQAGQIAGTNLGAYMNPYESQVVQSSLSDIDRARQMQANQLAAQATKAGAFGGSRAALMESELGRNALEQAAQASSQLRQAGFQNAQQLAGQDIASRMQADLANQGANLQAGTTNAQLMQAINLANQGALNTSGQFGASAANAAALQNAAARNAALQFGAGAANTASLQNAAARDAASQFGASAANQAALANQAARNAASQFGSSSANTAALQNAANLQAAAQFGAGAANTASLANQAARNQMAQYNMSNQLQAALANQSAGLQGANMRLGAANQMGNLANLGFGMGQQTQAMQAQSGALSQAINQALIDAAKGQYAGYTGAPAGSLSYMASALGATPGVSTTTQSKSPGLFDYLTLAALA